MIPPFFQNSIKDHVARYAVYLQDEQSAVLFPELLSVEEAIEEYVPSNNRSQIVKTKNNTLILDAYKTRRFVKK